MLSNPCPDRRARQLAGRLADSEDRMIHRAWMQGDFIAAEVEQYGPDESEPRYGGPVPERSTAGQHWAED